jgi:hypothetical protein
VLPTNVAYGPIFSIFRVVFYTVRHMVLQFQLRCFQIFFALCAVRVFVGGWHRLLDVGEREKKKDRSLLGGKKGRR